MRAHCVDRQATPAGLHVISVQRTQQALECKHPFSSIPSPPSLLLRPFSTSLLLLPALFASHTSPTCTYSAGHLAAGSTKQVCWGLLCQPQPEGFPGRRPNLFAILSSSGVRGLLLAAWRQLHPARGQGILGLLIHSFLSILHPNFQF